MRLLVLISLIVMGLLLTTLLSGVFLLVQGYSLEALMEMSKQGVTDFSIETTRILLLLQHLCTFMLPGLLFGYVFFRPAWIRGMDLDQKPKSRILVFAVFFLVAAYPLVNLSFRVNELLPLPSWALAYEAQAERTLRSILQMNTPWIFLLNLLIIGVLPGIGEELIFRGILQKELGGGFRSPILGIWLAALIFSAIHMQFAGFLPRMVLGVALGYLYYWTNNLWVPVITHAFNNGMQVALIYFTGMDVSAIDRQGTDQLHWWVFPIAIAIMYWLSESILKNRTHRDQV